MVKAQKIIYAQRFVGEPKLTDFQLLDEVLPALQPGEVLAHAQYLSVDPYMRLYMDAYPVGTTLIGGQVAKIIESRNDQFPVGTLVYGHFGWRTHTVYHPDDKQWAPLNPYALPSFGTHPASLGLGVLGVPGNTAYFGLLEICQPKAGETVVVTGAAGAVGSIVGQIAKALGCRVVGLAGDDAKCAWLRELGFDEAINYKKANVEQALKAAAPGGYDCYFDNVGGELSAQILLQMREFGRIAVCGVISGYNTPDDQLPRVQMLQPLFLHKSLMMNGFKADRWADRWQEGIEELYKLVEAGKVRYQETVTEGFERMPEAFIAMLRGGNTGKAVVKNV